MATLDRMIPLASTAPPAKPAAAVSPASGAPTPAAPTIGTMPPTPQPARPRRSRALPAVLAVLGLIVVIALCALLVRIGNDAQSGNTSGPGAVSTLGVDPTGGSRTGSEPTGGPVTTAPVTTVGIVDVAAVSGDDRAPALGQFFDIYFGSINAKAYDRMLSLYDPAGVIDPSNPKQRNALINGVSTSHDDNVRLVSVSSDGAVVLARVMFRSTQAAGAGPAPNRNETCTQWDVTYRLSQSGGEYRILGSSAQHQPC
jgi:hypothetical protein